MEGWSDCSWIFIMCLCTCIIQNQYGQASPMEKHNCCRREGDTYSCTGCGLNRCPEEIPNDIVHLDLSDNSIDDLGGCLNSLGRLESLDVSKNLVTKLHALDFEGTPALLSLDLRYNLLCLNRTSFPDDVFDSLPNLKKLQLINNKCSKGHVVYPEEALKSLTNLQSLSLPGLPNTDLGEGFKAMKSLKRLMFTGLYSNVSSIGCNMFQALNDSSLSHLSLRNSNINSICSSALASFHNLTYLNLACNPDIRAINIIFAINRMSNSTLRSLIIDGCKGQNSILLSDVTLGSTWKNMENLSFRSLSLPVTFDFLALLRAPKLKRLEAGGNFIIYQHRRDLFGIIRAFVRFSVESIDISHFGGFYPDFDERFCTPGNLDDEDTLFFPKYPENIKPLKSQGSYRINPLTITSGGQFLLTNLPPSVHYLSAEYFSFGLERLFSYKVNNYNQLWFVKVSNSKIDAPLATIETLNQLQRLYFENCSISRFGDNPLNYPSLTHLYLSGNNLEKIEYDSGHQSPFGQVTKLRYLDLSHNKLESIISEAFTNLTELKILKVANNKLTSVEFHISQLKQLRLLDLSKNQITKFPIQLMADLDEINQNRSLPIAIDWSENKLDCDCQSIDFLEWFSKTKVNIVQRNSLKCSDDSNVASVTVRSLKIQCFSKRNHLTYILPIVVTILLLALLIILIWKQRWRLLYWKYIVKEWIKSKRLPNDETCKIKMSYDVIICNAEEDDSWVMDNMVSRMEEEWSYRVFHRIRDIEPGESEVEAIFSAIKQSSVVVFVLTPAFTQNALCERILQMTIHMREDAFLLFRKEELPNLNRRHLVSRLTRTYSYLNYGSSEESQEQSWLKLKDFLSQRCALSNNEESISHDYTSPEANCFDNHTYSPLEFERSDKPGIIEIKEEKQEDLNLNVYPK